ncbi:hypothetical protein H5410_036162 [Solanum commersonii]|uniref:Uncharacterized protein n=1 Tax=Solanum commersonii TaxID=4109 RepID=A0A9J5Y4L6_SOLCO|nr:hypothetical protein H5410_036162 [Solanum commersonii]
MALVEVDYEGRIPIESISALEFSQGLAVTGSKIKSNWHGAIEPHAHHHNHAVNDEPNKGMKEEPEKDPREPTKEMEEDSEEY